MAAVVGSQWCSQRLMYMSARLVLCVIFAATSGAEDPKPVLGQLIHAHRGIHAMNRTELEAELDTRNAPHLPTDSEDELRMRLYHARSQLLQRRAAHVMHAEAILAEVNQYSDERVLAALSLDSVLADDNAIFMNAMGSRMLEGLKIQAGVGTIVGLLLMHFAPFGRLQRRMPLPISFVSPLVHTAAICAAGGALLGMLQVALQHVRRLAGAPSYFCQKLAAVTCRDAAVSWLLDWDEQQQQQRAPSASSASMQPVLPLWQRRGVLVPVLILATGSSIFEEVLFRGILLHALVAKARWRAGIASALTSVLFGLMHLKNDEGRTHGAIYAGWTCLGGLIFSAAYLGTQGSLIAPILLHFGLNALIFGDSALRVGVKLRADRQGFLVVSSRFELSRPTRASAASEDREAMSSHSNGAHGRTTVPAPATERSAASSEAPPGEDGHPLSRLSLSRVAPPTSADGELFLLAA